jgi:FKBP12-rapamycin complex-associated protein
MYTELSALLGESYNRAYNVVVRVQMLAELEEIITYLARRASGPGQQHCRHGCMTLPEEQTIQYRDRCEPSHPEKQDAMRKTWNQRLLGCQQNVEVWQRMLKVRALFGWCDSARAIGIGHHCL